MNNEDLGEIHECDVLIVGGGNAGINAAISARQEGASVVVMEKADPARSGSIGGGVDHFMTYLETGPEWDTRKGFLKWVGNAAKGAVDLRVQDAIFSQATRDELIERFAQVGSPLQQRTSMVASRTTVATKRAMNRSLNDSSTIAKQYFREP